ncbi:MAG: GNAT family N-acetyltransferase [Chloroflexota bacterium]|nr:GNAT family N-acetyltransferase [Chloroflexota bacterium]MBI5704454.1 GNAT family N-acetyltransferase [Chloroflexota bacterium]
MVFSIREFQYPQDYPAVRALWESMEKGVHLGRSDEPEEIQKKLSRDPDLFLLAEANGRIVGSIIGGYDGRRGLLYHLAVHKDFRQNGLGSRLLNEIEERLRAKGCLKCYLMVTPDNPEAERFYEKRGWHFMDYVRPFGKELI